MLEQITPEQFDEWVAFGCHVEPFGYEVEWLRTGTMTAMIYAANGGKGKGLNPSSYIPQRKRENTAEAFRKQMEAKYG